MKTILFLLCLFLCINLQAVTKQKLDTVKAKETVAKIDTCIVQIAKLDTVKINKLIEANFLELLTYSGVLA